MSFQKEVECIAAAHAMDMLTTPYVFNCDEAKLMVQAGADIIVAHMGLTTNGGSSRWKTAKTLQDCVRDVEAIVEICKSLRDDVIVLCHGGPIANPKDAAFILEKAAGVDGFYGASSIGTSSHRSSHHRTGTHLLGTKAAACRHLVSTGKIAGLPCLPNPIDLHTQRQFAVVDQGPRYQAS